MKIVCQKISLMLMVFMLGMSGLQLATAQGNSANAPGHAGNGPGKSEFAPGNNRNLGHGNASNGVKAIIKANRQIFYTGDLLEIGVRFPRGAELVQNGEVDAYLMIFEPDATLGALPISQQAGPETTNLFRIEELDADFLPEGVYQLGVVLTVPGGDPLNMADWYNGMLGLLTVRGLTVSSEALDIDDDGDGFVDDDSTGDGFVDDDESTDDDDSEGDDADDDLSEDDTDDVEDDDTDDDADDV